MKIFAMLSLLISVNAFAMTGEQVIERVAHLRGIEKSDIRRGMAVISRHTRRRLEQGCQVAIPGLGLIGNSDLNQDCNQRRNYPGDIDSAPEEKSRGIVMSFTGNSESSLQSCSDVERDFLENMYSFFEAEVARALDHNTTRSNRVLRISEQQSHNTTRSNRAIIMVAISNAMEEASDELCSIAQGKIDQEKFLEIIRSRVAELKLNDKLASNMFQNLNEAVIATFKRRALAAERVEAKKEDTRKLLVGAARASRLSVEELLVILKAIGSVTEQALVEGRMVEVPSFGNLHIRKRPGRTKYSNIVLKRAISTGNVVKFKAGSDLSGKVN